jgi:uncharacterized protein (TIGR00290 family)
MQKILLFWSGGKDSALALHYLKQDPNIQVVGLVSTIEQENGAIRFHGVKDTLIKTQAEMLNLPLQRIFIPKDCSNLVYEKTLLQFLGRFQKAGIEALAFGDIHQTEIRQYREELFNKIQMNCLFPLWQKNKDELLKTYFENGYKSIVTSIQKEKVDLKWLGKEFNQEFLDQLPSEVDPLGENGEYHTFLYFGPGFKMRVPFFKAVLGEDGPYHFIRLEEP